jgi:hypothetical protein
VSRSHHPRYRATRPISTRHPLLDLLTPFTVLACGAAAIAFGAQRRWVLAAAFLCYGVSAALRAWTDGLVPPSVLNAVAAGAMVVLIAGFVGGYLKNRKNRG